ncbi:MAG: hypothetical protein H7255_11590 [Ramlibacter sp.]|nr:hypothetical protein [Ramlibacter sp.]
MIREHVVETLEWDVAFASEHEAFDWQSRLASLIRGPAVDVISEVFDELGGASAVLTLDTLEIDLGRLSPDDFESQLKERLRACLREQLADELGRHSQGGAGAADASSSQSTSPSGVDGVEVLQQYLAQGFLSWQAGSGTRRRLGQLAERLALDRPEELAAFLGDSPDAARVRLAALLRDSLGLSRRRADAALLAGSTIDSAARDAWLHLLRWDGEWLLDRVGHLGQSTQVRRHMALHFGRALLLGYVGLAVPTEREFIASVIDEAAMFGRAMDPPVPPAQMEPRLWEFTLAYLIVERGSEFNRRSYIASLLRRGAEQEGMAYEALLSALMRALNEAGSAASSLQREMLRMLEALAQDGGLQLSEVSEISGDAAGVDADDDETDNAALEHGWLKLRVESLLLADVAVSGELRRGWTRLIESEPGWIAELVERLGQAARVRERMVRGFDDAMLFDVVALIVPLERGFIEGVIGDAQQFGQAMDPPVPAPQMRLQLWEFSLAYLLVERGSGFNRRSYLESLLRQAARREDVGYQQLLGALIASIERAGAIAGVQRDMLGLLQELRALAVPDVSRSSRSEMAKALPGTQRWRDIELPELRFEWQAALAAGLGAGQAGAAFVQHAWRDLAEHDSEWLLEVMARAAQSERTRRQIIEGLPQAVLVEWVDLIARGAGVFIEVVVGHASEVQRTASAPEARTRLWEFSVAWLLAARGSEFNRRSYMQAVLQRMAREEGRDAGELLQALVVGLRAAPSTGAMQRQLLGFAQDFLEQHGGGITAHATADSHANTLQGNIDQLVAVLGDAGLSSSLMSLASLGSLSSLNSSSSATASSSSALAASRAALERTLQSPQAVARAIAFLPARLLVRVVRLLRPTEHAVVLQSADAITRAAIAIGGSATRSRVEALKWQFILRYLFVQGRRFSAEDFARRFAEFLAASLRVDEPTRWRASLAQGIGRHSSGIGQTLAKTISAAVVAPRSAAPTLATSRARTPLREKKIQLPQEAPIDEPIYLANAGIVLAEPFLPHLFRMRGLMDANTFKDDIAAAKAVHLIQAVAYGAKEFREWQEHDLVLNKMLCGIELGDALAWQGELDAQDFSTVDGMLKAMTAQWKVLGSTSVDGLRETFLRREGRLIRKPDHWQLLVQAGPYDMLIDQVPWGFSTVRYPWMKGTIHVQWR